MKARIRNRVFESNSSSSHSVCVSGSEALDFGLRPDELREGVIGIAQSSEFGWQGEELTDTHSKIAYMMIQADPSRLQGGPGLGIDLVPKIRAEGSREANWLVDLIETATGCRLRLELGSNAGIDHQSVGVGTELFGDEERMRRFLFSPGSYLTTGNDNDDPYAYG